MRADKSFNPEGHRATNYARYCNTQLNTVGWYSVTYEGHYEPYLVAHRATLPRYGVLQVYCVLCVCVCVSITSD
jgi:hypothetical protein